MKHEAEPGPDYVVAEWMSQCTCCPHCNQPIPCDGVQAGGMCDDMCDCEQLQDSYNEDDRYQI